MKKTLLSLLILSCTVVTAFSQELVELKANVAMREEISYSDYEEDNYYYDEYIYSGEKDEVILISCSSDSFTADLFIEDESYELIDNINGSKEGYSYTFPGNIKIIISVTSMEEYKTGWYDLIVKSSLKGSSDISLDDYTKIDLETIEKKIFGSCEDGDNFFNDYYYDYYAFTGKPGKTYNLTGYDADSGFPSFDMTGINIVSEFGNSGYFICTKETPTCYLKVSGELNESMNFNYSISIVSSKTE